MKKFKHLLNQLQFKGLDDELTFVLKLLNYVRLLVLVGILVRFIILIEIYLNSKLFITAEIFLICFLALYFIFIEYQIRMGNRSQRFRIFQIYVDWFLMSGLYLMSLNFQSDTFLLLALPLVLSVTMKHGYQKFFPLILSSFSLLIIPLLISYLNGSHSLYSPFDYGDLIGFLVNNFAPKEVFLIGVYWILSVAFQFRERINLVSPQVLGVSKIYENLDFSIGLEAICEFIIKQNTDLLEADFGHLRHLDETTNELVMVAGYGPYSKFGPRKKRVGLDIAGKVALRDQPSREPDLDKVAHVERLRADYTRMSNGYNKFEEFLYAIQSELTIPLRLEGKIFGLATAQSIRENSFSKETISIFEDKISNALQVLEIYKYLSKIAITDLIHFVFNLEKSFQNQIHHAIDIFQAYTGNVRLYDQKHKEIVYLVGQGPFEYFLGENRKNPIGSDHFSMVISENTTLDIPNLDLDPHFHRLKKKYMDKERLPDYREFEEFLTKAKSELLIPLHANDEVIGCCILHATEHAYFLKLKPKITKDFFHLMNQISKDISDYSRESGIPVIDLIDFCVNLKTNFQKILNDSLTAENINAEYGHIRLLDFQEDEKCDLMLVADKGPYRFFSKERLNIDDSFYGEIYRNGRAYLTSQLPKEPHIDRLKVDFKQHKQEWENYGSYLNSIKSELVVPLKIGNRVIGTSTVQSKQKNFFNATKENLFLNSMKYASMIIENIELTEKMDKLQTRIKNMASPAEFVPVLEYLALSSIEILGADVVTISEYDRNSDNFLRPILKGILIYPEFPLAKTLDDDIRRIMVSNSKPEFFCEDAKMIPEELDSPILKNSFMDGKGFINRELIASAAGILLKAKDDIVGVMFFNFRQRQNFSENRKELMKILASQAAIVIRNARLFKLSKERGETIEDLQKAQKRLVNKLEMNEALETILKEALDLFDANSGHIRLFNNDTKKMVLVAGVGEYYKIAKKEVEAGESISGYLVNNPGPIAIENTEKKTLWPPNLFENIQENNPELYEYLQNEKSLVCFRLTDDNVLIGTICLSSTKKGTFTQEKLVTLDEYLEMALFIIQNARKFSKAVTLNEIMREMAEITDENKLFDKILEGGLKLVEKDCGAISRFDLDSGELNVVANRGEGTYLPKLRFGQGITGLALEQGNPIRVDDVKSEEWKHKYKEGWKKCRSELAVPIILENVEVREGEEVKWGNKPIGIFNVESAEVGTFTRSDEEFLKILAGHAAVMIERLEFNKKLAELNKVETAILGNRDLDKTINIVLNAIIDTLGFKFVNISLVIPELNRIKTKYFRYLGISKEEEKEFMTMANHLLDSNDIQADIVRKKKIEVPGVNDPRFDTEIYNRFHHDQVIRVYIPMIEPTHNRIIGTVEAGYQRYPRKFIYERDVQILKDFVEYAVLALEQRDKALLEKIEHDFRSPIVGIRSNLDFLQRKYNFLDDRKKQEKFADMFLDTEILLNQVQELGYILGRPTPSSYVERTLVFKDLIIKTVNQLKKLAIEMGLNSSNIIINPSDHHKIDPIYVNRVQLNKVIYNLITNAIKYAEDDPAQFKIHISIDNTPEFYIIKFQDWGIGVQSGIEEKIFEDGFRAPDAIDKHVSGTGLGLSIARNIMRQLGGDLKLIHNSKPTEFHVFIPQKLREKPI